MRFPGFRLICSCALLLQIVVVRCDLKTQSVDTVTRVLACISADDENWYEILKQDVRFDRQVLGPHVIDMLNEMHTTGTVIRVHSVLSYLVSRSDATGTQMHFGVDVIGDGLSCQFMKTALMHLKFTQLYGFRRSADMSSARSCLSRIQVVMAGYVDKLFAFGRPIDHFVKVIQEINLLFSPVEIRSERFIELVEKLLKLGSSLLGELCPLDNDYEPVKTVKVTSFDDDRLTGQPVDDLLLLDMIKDMDEYRYVEFRALGVDYWLEYLGITPNVMQESQTAMPIDTDDNDMNADDDDDDGNYNYPFAKEL